MHEYGQRKPETMAYTCNVMCVLTVIGAVIAFFAIGGQSKEAESGGLYSAATPAVNMWPLAVVVLALGLTSAVMWFGRSVLFSWLSARYAQAERVNQPTAETPVPCQNCSHMV